jgi:hypothetical protein
MLGLTEVDMRLLTVLLLLIFLVTTAVAFADSSTCPLTGIKTISEEVNVQGDTPGITIDTGGYQARIELELGHSGVTVVPKQGDAFLSTSIYVMKTTNETTGAEYAVDVDTDLIEVAQVPRLGLQQVVVTTWSSEIDCLWSRYRCQQRDQRSH